MDYKKSGFILVMLFVAWFLLPAFYQGGPNVQAQIFNPCDNMSDPDFPGKLANGECVMVNERVDITDWTLNWQSFFPDVSPLTGDAFMFSDPDSACTAPTLPDNLDCTMLCSDYDPEWQENGLDCVQNTNCVVNETHCCCVSPDEDCECQLNISEICVELSPCQTAFDAAAQGPAGDGKGIKHEGIGLLIEDYDMSNPQDRTTLISNLSKNTRACLSTDQKQPAEDNRGVLSKTRDVVVKWPIFEQINGAGMWVHKQTTLSLDYLKRHEPISTFNNLKDFASFSHVMGYHSFLGDFNENCINLNLYKADKFMLEGTVGQVELFVTHPVPQPGEIYIDQTTFEKRTRSGGFDYMKNAAVWMHFRLRLEYEVNINPWANKQREGMYLYP